MKLCSITSSLCSVSLQPAVGRLGPSAEKVAVVAVDNCDVEVAIRFGSRITNYSCAAQRAQTGLKK